MELLFGVRASASFSSIIHFSYASKKALITSFTGPSLHNQIQKGCIAKCLVGFSYRCGTHFII